jgi:16S rRNA pseudouridine516 synthase
MHLENVLFSQGFGSRRQCRALIAGGAVSIHGRQADDPGAACDVSSRFEFEVNGTSWCYQDRVYLMLHKPGGYECSREPQHHPSVFSLLPSQFAQRGVQCVGRLDQDTTGLLLLSDDGAFIHAHTSPKRKVPKTYLATTHHEIDDTQLRQLLAGVVLRGEREPSLALSAIARDPHHLEMSITEGKYHQVKRMVAAIGNQVEALHRTSIGTLTLPAELAPGQWRWLQPPNPGSGRI